MTPDASSRAAMVERDIVRRGVSDERVLAAMRAVPREAFVPAGLRARSHDDGPLPIGRRQTISQPYIVALMAEALRLRGDEHVLEIGTGSGYGAAVLARLCAQVVTVERIAELAERAAARLAELGVPNVRVQRGDGSLGWPDAAPYDAIVVTASGPSVPEALLAQLATGGRLVMPVGGAHSAQELVRVTRDDAGNVRTESLCDVAFVPLVGAGGWPESES